MIFQENIVDKSKISHTFVFLHTTSGAGFLLKLAYDFVFLTLYKACIYAILTLFRTMYALYTQIYTDVVISPPISPHFGEFFIYVYGFLTLSISYSRNIFHFLPRFSKNRRSTDIFAAYRRNKYSVQLFR